MRLSRPTTYLSTSLNVAEALPVRKYVTHQRRRDDSEAGLDEDPGDAKDLGRAGRPRVREGGEGRRARARARGVGT
jgi:hypothetical protein